MVKCKYKVGLLQLRDCGSISENSCAACSRPVCGVHSRTAAEGTLCVECYMKKNKEANDPASDSVLRNARGRSRLYLLGAFVPLYYGHGRMYGDEDYDTFDADEDSVTSAVVEGEQGDDLISPEEFQDS